MLRMSQSDEQRPTRVLSAASETYKSSIRVFHFRAVCLFTFVLFGLLTANFAQDHLRKNNVITL